MTSDQYKKIENEIFLPNIMDKKDNINPCETDNICEFDISSIKFAASDAKIKTNNYKLQQFTLELGEGDTLSEILDIIENKVCPQGYYKVNFTLIKQNKVEYTGWQSHDIFENQIKEILTELSILGYVLNIGESYFNGTSKLFIQQIEVNWEYRWM